MRSVGTVSVAAVASSVIAAALIVAAVYLRLGISLGPHQKFEVILLIVVQVIVALGTACSIAARREPNDWAQIARLRDDLESRLFSSFPDAYLNSTKGNRLPNTSNFGFPGIDSDALVAYLGSQDICVSSGSACMESSLAPSHVIMAMRQNHQQAGEALRISLGLMTTEGEITRLVELLEAFVPTVR